MKREPTRSPSITISPSTSPNAGPPRLIEVGRFEQPTFVGAPPGDPRLFVVEKAGRIQVISNGKTKTFLDLRGRVSNGGERGLFSIAFAPDYAQSGLAYVDYTDTGGDTRIDEFRVSADPDRADPSTRRTIISIRQPYANHNGGQVTFDPRGMLIIGMGDGGSGDDPENRAQNMGSLLGKLLRIDPRNPSRSLQYGIPPDNPFQPIDCAGSRCPARPRPEIWASGVRNPWRFTFDEQDRLWLADVGQDSREEIDLVEPKDQSGANYGWRVFEGDHRNTSESIDESKLIKPLFTYDHTGGRCSITGGGLYRGEVTALRGLYLFADLCDVKIKTLTEAGVSGETGLSAPTIVSFGEGANGQMYVVSLEGPVYRITS